MTVYITYSVASIYWIRSKCLKESPVSVKFNLYNLIKIVSRFLVSVENASSFADLNNQFTNTSWDRKLLGVVFTIQQNTGKDDCNKCFGDKIASIGRR